jgi:hypothetical protein
MIDRTPEYAIAVDVRRVDTEALLGVALLVASQRQVSYLKTADQAVSEPSASTEVWRDIDEWNSEVARRLPFKPPAMGSATAAILFGCAGDTPVVARRFAAIPMSSGTLDAPAIDVRGLLPSLLKARRQS